MSNLEEEKNELIVKKSNRLIQNVINHCNYYQNKILFALLGKYNKEIRSENDSTIEISISELCELLGYKEKAGNINSNIVQALIDFRKSGVDIACEDENGNLKYLGISFFKSITVENNICKFQWNDELAKRGLLGKKIEQYYLLEKEYLQLKSVYTQLIYEWLSAHKNYEKRYGSKPEIEIEELKRMLEIQDSKTYAEFKEFNKKIIKKSIDEINKVTKLEVSYETKKMGRKVISIVFSIQEKAKHYENRSEHAEEILRCIDLDELYSIGFRGSPTGADKANMKRLIKTYDYSSVVSIFKNAYYYHANSMSYINKSCENLGEDTITDIDSDKYIDPCNVDNNINKIFDIWQSDGELLENCNSIDDFNAALVFAFKYYTYWEVVDALRYLSARQKKFTYQNIRNILKNIIEERNYPQ